MNCFTADTVAVMNDEYWDDVAATPWHKRDLKSIEQVLTPPVSRWGRLIYWALFPVAVLVLIAVLLIFPY